MATPTNLPAAQTTGNVLTAAYMNDLRGSFRILQVVNAGYSTGTTNATTTFAATGLSASITPQSSSSKILVLLNQAGVGRVSGNGSNVIELRRGSTQLATQNAAYTNNTDTNMIGTASIIYLDSPSTTSATTYDSRFKADAASCSVIVQDGSSYSSITLLEVSA
jgi:hypothetical protein